MQPSEYWRLTPGQFYVMGEWMRKYEREMERRNRAR